jgi:hypothetical protein
LLLNQINAAATPSDRRLIGMKLRDIEKQIGQLKTPGAGGE